MVFDRSGRVPKPGWVEHDPEEIWRRTQEVIADAMQQRAVLPKRTRGHGHHEPARNSRCLESKARQAYCKCHLARAVPEATAFQAREVVEAMERDAGIKLDVLGTGGGMVRDEPLMQFQPDILERPMVRPVTQETTALGACYAAGLAVGFFKDTTELRANWSVDLTWQPRMEEKAREEMYRLWKKAVTRSFDWWDRASSSAK